VLLDANKTKYIVSFDAAGKIATVTVWQDFPIIAKDGGTFRIPFPRSWNENS